MNILLMSCGTLSLILLAAHYLRSGDISLVFAIIGSITFVFIKRRWSRYISAMILVAGIPVWIMSFSGAIHQRIAAGLPWIRLSVIMGLVILFFIFISFLCFKSVKSIKKRETDLWAGAAVLLTVVLLIIGRWKAPYQMIILDRFIPGSGMTEIVFLGIYSGFITELFLTLKNTSKLRVRIWAGFSVIFFLQFILGISGMDQFLMTGNLHIPVPAVIVGGPVFRGSGFFMVTLFFVTIAAAGPAWCSYFCYFGAWDNVAARSAVKCGSIPAKNILNRILILAIIVLTAYLFRIFYLSEIAAASAAICFGITGLIIMRVISAKRGVMIHCTSYCPIGLIAALTGKISPFRMRIEKTCSSCMACSKVCRYGALGNNEIKSHKPGLTCTLCGDCVNVCHNNSIHYNFFGLSPKKARALFTVIVVSIHAVFLGFARI